MDFDKLTEEEREELERALFVGLCRNIDVALGKYSEYISDHLADKALTYFDKNPESKTYKVKIRFWGGFANEVFSFFVFEDIMRRKFWDVWAEGSVKVKVKLDKGECIIKCKFTTKPD